MTFLNSLGSFSGHSKAADSANSVLIVSVLLFAASIPHSIAAAHIALDLGVLAWLARDLITRRLHFARTPFDLPILGFCFFSILAAIFSEEPSLSRRKLLSLLLFGVIYLLASNLSRRGVHWFLGFLLFSGFVGAAFSVGEKVVGRGLIVTAIQPGSPLEGTNLKPADVIWMVGRHRVSSLEDISRVIGGHRSGDRIEIEGIHAGDPLPVTFLITDGMNASENPLKIEVAGRSRGFRVSGFSRHFLTFAEQMQIFALLALTALLVWPGIGSRWLWVMLAAGFTAALLFTATRIVFVSFLMALVATALLRGSRRVILGTVAAAILLAGIAVAILLSTRAVEVTRLIDDSPIRRLSYMRAGLRLIPAHPLLGVGMDSHKLHWQEWGFPGDYITHTHSTPIQIAVDRGLPALGCLIWFFVLVARWQWRWYRRARESDLFLEWLALGGLSALMAFAASSLVNYNFGDSEVLLLLLALVGVTQNAQAEKFQAEK